MTGRRGGRIFKVEEMSRVKAVGWGRVGPVVSALGARGAEGDVWTGPVGARVLEQNATGC